MIALSTITFEVPLVCRPGSLIEEAVLSHPRSVYSAATTPDGRRFASICQTVSVAGRVLDYIHSLKTRCAPAEDYLSVDRDMRALATEFIAQDDSHRFTFCDSIAMTLR